MRAFTVHTGTAVPLRRTDVDTDQIIPVRYCRRVTRTGFEDALFHDWRADDPGFPLNRPEYGGATVLVAGTDFGTGSSREFAVWALQDYGFRAILAPRFGDIFLGNALKNGLLPVVVPADVVENLWKAIEDDPTTGVTVDLERREVRAAGVTVTFDVSDDTRWRLLNGLDDVSVTEMHADAIADYERRRRPALPTTGRRD